MHEIMNLKEKLCKELEDYGKRSQLDANSLNIVDKLAHAVKNLNKIIESQEGSYADGSYDESYERSGRGMSRGNIKDGMGNYHFPQYTRYSERGMSGRGSYANSRYSRNEGMVEQLRELMDEAPDEKTRLELEKLIRKMEDM